MKHPLDPATLMWPDSHELAEDYARGINVTLLARTYKHPRTHIKAYLQHLGIWRTRSEAAKMRQAREKARRLAMFSHLDPWGLSDIDLPMPHASKAREFVPMLTVRIADGAVLLDRMREATRAFDRFEVRRCEG